MQDVICTKIYNTIAARHQLNPIEVQRLKYGLSMFYLAISKYFLLLAVAWITNFVVEFFIVLTVFNVLRTTSFGVHAKSARQCLITSVLFLIIIPKCLVFYHVSGLMINTLSLLLPICHYFYAPADTARHPLVNVDLRNRLKLRSTLRSAAIALLVILLPFHSVKICIFAGLLTQAFLISPVAYMLLNERRNNYEQYSG